ncbi:MAG: gliding motility protein SprB [Bacteroidota bacterium]|jgi:hypothetical protein
MNKPTLPFLIVLLLSAGTASGQCPPPGYPQTGDLCAVAPVLCTDLNGYCATLGTNNQQQTFPGCGGNVLNNDEWFGFIAGTTSITIEVIPSNCQGVNGQFGMQAAIYEGSCSGPAVATQCNCVNSPFQLQYSNYVVGQAYYVVFDGCGGDICDFQVNVLDGSTLPVPPEAPSNIIGPENVCPGATSLYTVPVPNGATYNWSVIPASMGSIVSPNPGESVNVLWTNLGSAQICVTASNPCFPPTAPVCMTVTSQAIPPTNEAPMSICLGDCIPCAGQLFCAATPPNGTPVTVTSWLGCDSVVRCTINVIPPINVNIGQVTFCAPYTYEVCGVPYTSSGFLFETCDNYQGCDSTTQVDLAILEPIATIDAPDILGCGNNAAVIISGVNSTFALVPDGQTDFLWTGPGIVGPDDEVLVQVDEPGEYCLTVTHSRNGVVCSDTKCVTVTQNTAVPAAPAVNGPLNPCEGVIGPYTVVPVGTPAPTGYSWSTPNGEPFTQVTPTSVSVDWSGSGGGQLCVTADNDCGASPPTCIQVNVLSAPPLPDITGPVSVCGSSQALNYAVANPQAGVNYSWTVPAGASFSGSGGAINVNFSGAAQGNAQVCVTAANNCDTLQTCLDIVITSLPATPVLNGPTNTCTSQQPVIFTVNNAAAGNTYSWTVPTGAVVSGTGASVSVDFSGAVTGQVCVSAENGCGASTQACQNVQVILAPVANISGSDAFCQGDSTLLSLPITISGTGAPWTLVYQVNGSGGDTVSVPSSPFNLQAGQAGVYSIVGVATVNGCQGTASGTGEIVEFPAPTAMLSGTGAICQGSGQTASLPVMLTGTAPWTIGWAANGNPQAAQTATASPFSLPVSQSQAGTVTLTSLTDGNGCEGTVDGTGSVVVNTAPVVSSIQTECDPTNTSYIVSFVINNGDPASYMVVPQGNTANGTLTGQTFVSDPIPSGDGYDYVVSDANACASISVSDNAVVCNCTTQAGLMDQNTLNTCGDGPVTADYDNATEMLDGDDLLVFVLHNGSGLTVVPPVIATSATPEVSFDAAFMNYGQTYYLSAVVGSDDGTGMVDLTDDCLSVAQGTPLVFYEVPTALLSGDTAVCQGEPAGLPIALTGQGPWAVTYGNGTATVPVNGINSSAYLLIVTPAASTAYTLLTVTDGNCPGTVSGTANVTVQTAVQFDNLAVNCNNTNTAYTVSFDISGGDPGSYVVSGLPGTISNGSFLSDPVPTGTGFSLLLDDANGCAPKTIEQSLVVCNCSSEAGDMDPMPVDHCGTDSVSLPSAIGFALDGDDLLHYFLHTGASNVLGTVVAVNVSSPTFAFDPATMTYGTQYYVSAVVGSDDGSGAVTLSDPCLSVAPGTPVRFFEIPGVSLSGTQEICPGNSAVLSLELTGSSPWSVVVNGQTVPGIVGTPFDYTVTPSVTTDYQLTEVFNQHCSQLTDQTVTVTVHEPPTIANLAVTCNDIGTAYTVCFDIVGGDAAGYDVSPAVGTLLGNQFCSDEIAEGQGFSFTLTDGHGCPPVVVQQDEVECACLSNAGVMDPSPQTVCGNGPTAAPIYDAASQTLDPNDVQCFVLHDGNQVPIVMNASGVFSFNPQTMTYGQTYYVAAVVGNDNGSGCVNLSDPCKSFSGDMPLVFYQKPTAVLSGSADICAGASTDLSVALTGEGPWDFSYLNALGNQVDVQAAVSPFLFPVTPTQSVVYTLTDFTDANCAGTVSGNAVVSVNTAPGIINEITSCNPANTAYTVSFSISGGDAASYSVMPGGMLTGSDFISDPIPSGAAYAFSVDDANGCGPTLVEGQVLCDCTTDAGAMSAATVVVCGDEQAVAQPVSSPVLDGDDILVYILHTAAGNVPGTILAQGASPAFDFQPVTMSYNTTYYISALVGNADGSGGVTLNDPCLSLAPGTPVIFRQLPQASVSASQDICQGADAQVGFTVDGVGPFELTFSVNNLLQTIPLPAPGTFPLTLTPSSQTSVALVQVTDLGTGCSTALNSGITINVISPANAGTAGTLPVFCEGQPLVVDLDTYLSGADPGGSWTGPFGVIPAGDLGLATWPAGSYELVYTITGTPPCPDAAVAASLQIAAQPAADAGPDQNLNCDVVEVTLGGNVGGSSDLVYEWSGGTLDDPAAPNPTTETPGVYTLTVSNAEGCSATDVVVVNQQITNPELYASVSAVSCFGRTDGSLVVDSVLQGQPPFLFALNGAAFSTQNQFVNLSPGDYVLTMVDAAGCESAMILTVTEPAEVTVAITGDFPNGDPVVELGESLLLTLESNPPFFQLDTVRWSEGGVDSCTACRSITVTPQEQTTYSVRVGSNGCFAEDLISVFVRKERTLFVPTAFSPNDDGINDLLTVFPGRFVESVRSFRVLNRWGEEVYALFDLLPGDPPFGWDGRYRGMLMNPGVFVWMAEVVFKDGSMELYEGEVNLVR